MTILNRKLTYTTTALCSGTVLSLALCGAAIAQETPGNAAQNANEIIVTAQKREERLKDVPVPITAIRSDSLLAQNQTKAQDFFSTIPAVNLQFQNGRAQLAIRGITTGPVTGNPTIGYTVDDVPYGSSTGQGGLFGSAPDLDPSELARIEVLRGPQGTLYGASSIGGLLKYVTIDPSTDKISGSVGGGVLLVKDGGGTLGYNLRGAINLPVGETFAVRASMFHRDEPGFIDNARTGRNDVNASKVTGGRVSALWKPSDSFSLKLGAMHQVRNIYGSSNADITTGSFSKQTDIAGAGRSRAENQMFSAVMNADLGTVNVASISAYSRSKNYDFIDFTNTGLTFFVFPPIFFPITEFGDNFRQGYDVDKFSQELRFSGGVGDNIDWIVGGFYTHEDAKYRVDANATNPNTGEIYGTPIQWRDSLKFDEWAAFGNATVRLSDKFDVQFGGRYSENTQNFKHRERNIFPVFDNDGNPILGQSQVIIANTDPRADGHSFTYQVSPRFKPSPDHMIYGRVASGYRPGGTNANCNSPLSAVPVPCQFKPDKIVNYELGAKGDLLDRLLSYDVSAFLIDWKDIQISQLVGENGFTYNGNAGRARSKGVEVSLEARPVEGLNVKAWLAYIDAKLAEDINSNALFGLKGDALPYNSKWSGRFSVDYVRPLSDSVTASFGASLTYVGNRRGEFVNKAPDGTAPDAPLRQVYPEYAALDLNAGLDINAFTVQVFLQNVTNKRGVIGGGFNNQTSFNPNWFNYTQPRTIGLNVSHKF
ncbi:outer membrane receptor protein involved in Fe transport [Novosphingobium hassiacum]|uniref:Outer membrane receptor protein involved in Fe transport n=1 Tax=Novosphingobium hassiacum TaxID=173676 RepID=A0A7W5ZX16_9SPHN|nr:TonB-dependent receptor [Novosphingobium hassiacum]MBB3859395.1 outer membrane receptor protein involved in Fe transport [Novosphingobium hassiacum]